MTTALVWKCVHGVALVEGDRGRSRLLPASIGCIQLSRVQTSTGQQSFVFSGPAAWKRAIATTVCNLTHEITIFFVLNAEVSSTLQHAVSVLPDAVTLGGAYNRGRAFPLGLQDHVDGRLAVAAAA